MAIAVGAVARYLGHGFAASLGLALLSLLLMQVIYFLFVLLAVWREKHDRQQKG